MTKELAMAGALRKTMVYLGLAEDVYGDDVYDDYDEPDQAYAQAARSDSARTASRGEGQVTAFPARNLTQVPSPAAGMQRITTIHPRTYNDAKTIGEAFRDGVPVIMNLTDMGDADAKRLVDFAAGLVFGLHGAIERVTAKVFLLSPAHVEVLAEDKDDEAVPGPFNQS
jgi:cell division inhibitor SepF